MRGGGASLRGLYLLLRMKMSQDERGSHRISLCVTDGDYGWSIFDLIIRQ
jgi:hypothetical protein